MANANAPFGFRPLRHLRGGIIRPNSAGEWRIADGYNTAIYYGHPVKLADDGTIQLAAAGDRMLGIFAGCQFVAADGEVHFEKYWPASQDLPGSSVNYARAYVFDDPDIAFVVQSGGTPGVTNIGNLADHVAGTANTVMQRSGAYLSGTMADTKAGFRILDIVNEPGNVIGQYAKLIVQIYEHELTDAFYDAALGGAPGV